MNIYVSEFKPKKADYILASRWCLDQNQNHIPILAYNFTEYAAGTTYVIGDIVRASVAAFGWAFYKARRDGTLSAPQNHTTADWEFIEMVYPTIPAGKIFKLPANPDDYADHDLYFTNKTAIDTFGKGMFMDPGQPYLKTPAYDGDQYVSPSYGAHNIAIPYGMTADDSHWAPLIGEKAEMIFDQAPTSRLPDAKMNESLWVNTYKPADGEYFTCETPYKQIPVGVCTDYISLVWNDKLYETGDFQLTLIDTPDNRKLFKSGRWIQIPNSDRVMIIEKIEFNAALKSDGYLMNVSGRGLSSILDRRVSFPGLSLNTSECTKDGGFVYGIERLVEAYFIDPTIPIATNNLNQNPDFYYPERHISCLKIGRDYRNQFPDLNPTAGTNNVPHTSINRTVSNEVVLETIQEACSKSNIGFRMDIEHDDTYDCDWLVFKLYQGQKRLYNTDHPLIFSSKMNNVDSVAVTTDSTEYKNFFFCGKEKDADSYIDFAATQTVDPSSMVGELISKSKAATSISNWVKTNLQDNDITRTAILFIAIAAWRADNGGDQTVSKIEQYVNGQWVDYARDANMMYAYPVQIISGLYRITFKKIVGGSSSNPDGYFYTDDNADTPDGWVESFKLSTAYGWLTTDFLKEAKAQAKAKIATGIVGYAKYSAMNAWFSNMDRYTSTYSQVKWLCGTHSIGEPGMDGLNRREQFVEEEKEEDNDWDTSDILNWKQQTNVVKVGQDKDEESDEDIVKRLTASAIKQSGQYRQRHDIDVKCNSDVTKYRVDYNLGDIVQVDDEHGTNESYMITEVAIANDTSKGEQAIPTFQKYSRIPSQYTELEYLAVSNMILPVVFDKQPISNVAVETGNVHNELSHLMMIGNMTDPNPATNQWSDSERVFSISGYSDREFMLTEFETDVSHVPNPSNEARYGAEYVAPGGTLKAAVISVDGYEHNRVNNSFDSRLEVYRDYPFMITRDFYEYPDDTKAQLHSMGFKIRDNLMLGVYHKQGIDYNVNAFDENTTYNENDCCYRPNGYYKCKSNGVRGTWENVKNNFDLITERNTISAICNGQVCCQVYSDDSVSMRRDKPGIGLNRQLRSNSIVLSSGKKTFEHLQSKIINGTDGEKYFEILLPDSSKVALKRNLDRNILKAQNVKLLTRKSRVYVDDRIAIFETNDQNTITDIACFGGEFSNMNELTKILTRYAKGEQYDSSKNYKVGDVVYLYATSHGRRHRVYYILKRDLEGQHISPSNTGWWIQTPKWVVCKYVGVEDIHGYVIQNVSAPVDVEEGKSYSTNQFIDILDTTWQSQEFSDPGYAIYGALQILINRKNSNGDLTNLNKTIALKDRNNPDNIYLYRTFECPQYVPNQTYQIWDEVMFGGVKYFLRPDLPGGETSTDRAPDPTDATYWMPEGDFNITTASIGKILHEPGNERFIWHDSSGVYNAVQSPLVLFRHPFDTATLRPVHQGDYVCIAPCDIIEPQAGTTEGSAIETAYMDFCVIQDIQDQSNQPSDLLTDYNLMKYLIRVANNSDNAKMRFDPSITAIGSSGTFVDQITANLTPVWCNAMGVNTFPYGPNVPQYDNLIVDPVPFGAYVQDQHAEMIFDRHVVLGGYRRRIATSDGSIEYSFDPLFTDNDNGYAFKTLKFYETRAVDRHYEIMGYDSHNMVDRDPTGTLDPYVLEDGRIDPYKISQEFRAQIIDPSSRKQTHEFVPVKYNGADGDDYANLRDVDKYGFYDVDEQRFIPINFSPDGTENRAAKFCSAGPELAQNT